MRVFGTWYGKKSRNHSLLVVSSVHVANGSPPSPWTATMLWYILEMAMQRKWQKTYSATAVSVSFRIKSPVFSLGAHLVVVGISLGGSAPPPPLTRASIFLVSALRVQRHYLPLARASVFLVFAPRVQHHYPPLKRESVLPALALGAQFPCFLPLRRASMLLVSAPGVRDSYPGGGFGGGSSCA